MQFQIEAEGFEESEETKRGSMRYRILEAVERTNYLENIYEQKAACIETRRKNLDWAIGLTFGMAGILVLLAVIMLVMTSGSPGVVFSMWPVLVLNILAAVLVISACRKIASVLTHKGVFAAPLRLIYNRRIKHCSFEELQAVGVYTLAEEEQDCRQLLRQIRDDRKALLAYLETPEAAVEQGEDLLSGMEHHFEEKDRKATLLYGERV